MTTDLSVYRSDREQLLARVRELEEELAELKPEAIEPFKWLRSCPMCGYSRQLWGDHVVERNLWAQARYPKACSSFWCRIFHKPHAHQKCTACDAHWIVDAHGWKFK